VPSIESAPISEAPWSVSTTDYRDASHYCASCLIDGNPSGSDKQVGLCKLPIFTPSGALSRAAVANATARFNQVQGGGKDKAKSMLVAAHRRLKMAVPAILGGGGGGNSANSGAMNKMIRGGR